jgi:hypothetical protein
MYISDGVRSAIEAMDREVSRLAAHASVNGAARLRDLLASWNTLIDLLELGPRPERRECPHCGSVGMRNATRCGRCWMELVPPAPSEPVAGRDSGK